MFLVYEGTTGFYCQGSTQLLGTIPESRNSCKMVRKHIKIYRYLALKQHICGRALLEGNYNNAGISGYHFMNLFQ